MESSSSTSNFKQFLLRFAIPVVVVLAVLFYGLNWVLESTMIYNYDSNGGYKVHRMLYENDVNEIPIYGSSRANGSYIPSLIDSNCFNYGLEKTEIDYLLICLETELTKDRSTPIIINFDYGLFARKIGDIAHFVPSVGHPAIQEYLDSLYSFRMQVPLMKYFGHLETYSKTVKAEQEAFHCLDRGCFILKDPTTEVFKESLKLRRESKSHFIVDTVKKQKLINLFKESSRQIYLVVAPYHRVFFESYVNMPDARKFLDSADALKSVKLIDLGEMELEDDEYLNTGHVNYWGAKKFSEKLSLLINLKD